jgi:hypothetical protein
MVPSLQAPAQSSVNVGSAPGFPGSVVSLPVSVRRTTNVTAAQFDLAYNPARTIAGTGLNSGAFSNHVVRAREIAPGLHRVLIFSRNNTAITVTNSRPAVRVPFTVQPTEYIGSGPIVATNLKLSQPDGAPVSPLTSTAGSIFVRSVNVQSDGAQLFLPSEPGFTYVVEATTNFVHWANIATNAALGEYLDAFDPFATNFLYRFYRTRRDP